MLRNASLNRYVVVAVLVLIASRPGVRPLEGVSLAAPLDVFPRALEQWRGVDEPPLDPETLAILGADDYLNRVYRRPDGAIASVYIGYYGTQRQGDSIHSPRNCLPGNGWQPVSRSQVMLSLGGQQAPVNRFVIAKQDARQVVLYWFEGRGRVVANEFVNKWFMLTDGLRLGRSEGGLVRLIAPIANTAGPSPASSPERPVDEALLQLGRVVHGELARWLP